jgi:hypothetical protein
LREIRDEDCGDEAETDRHADTDLDAEDRGFRDAVDDGSHGDAHEHPQPGLPRLDVDLRLGE